MCICKYVGMRVCVYVYIHMYRLMNAGMHLCMRTYVSTCCASYFSRRQRKGRGRKIVSEERLNFQGPTGSVLLGG
jgi:hypothetical protein